MEEINLGDFFFDKTSVKKQPVKGDLREIKRREYKPPEIKVLFTCESLPKDNDNFFYYSHSPLHKCTLQAFQKVFKKITQSNFLQCFNDLEFYLDDLCSEAVNHLKKGNDKKKRDVLRELYEPDLSKRVALYQPQFIIITPKEIKENIVRVISTTNLEIPYRDLPFPAGNNDNAVNYVDELVELLKELIDKKMINYGRFI